MEKQKQFEERFKYNELLCETKEMDEQTRTYSDEEKTKSSFTFTHAILVTISLALITSAFISEFKLVNLTLGIATTVIPIIFAFLQHFESNEIEAQYITRIFHKGQGTLEVCIL